MQIIDARVSRLGAFGHGYFRESPAVSSDVVLLERPSGEANGRPLRVGPNGFWMIDDDYPTRSHERRSGRAKLP
jgi:hypothetical protein